MQAQVQVGLIRPHPRIPNWRGGVVNTTELQASMKEDGQTVPIIVMPAEDDEGYWLLDGKRRTVAATQLGWGELEATVKHPRSDLEALMIIASSHQRREVDDVVLEGGEIVGGKAWMVAQMKGQGLANYKIAPVFDIRPDVVGAYLDLFGESTEMKEAVANGRLAITVYSLIRNKDEEIKAYLLSRPGNISADMVRKTVANWDSIKARMEAGNREDEGEEQDDSEATSEFEPAKKETSYSPAQLLQKALTSLRAIEDGEISWEQEFLLAAIGVEYERLVEAM